MQKLDCRIPNWITFLELMSYFPRLSRDLQKIFFNTQPTHHYQFFNTQIHIFVRYSFFRQTIITILDMKISKEQRERIRIIQCCQVPGFTPWVRSKIEKSLGSRHFFGWFLLNFSFDSFWWIQCICTRRRIGWF